VPDEVVDGVSGDHAGDVAEGFVASEVEGACGAAGTDSMEGDPELSGDSRGSGTGAV
jgi:hypothetical protein